MADYVSGGRRNLRGWGVVADFDGDPRFARVITHTRNGRWVIQSEDRKRQRISVSENDLMLVASPNQMKPGYVSEEEK